MKAPASCRRLQKTAPSGRAGVRAMKGPCGPDGGRRRNDAASPGPMYRMTAGGFAARQTSSARRTITQWRTVEKGVPVARVYRPSGQVGLARVDDLGVGHDVHERRLARGKRPFERGLQVRRAL